MPADPPHGTDPQAPGPARARLTPRTVLSFVVPVVAAVALLAFLLPSLTGVGWKAVSDMLARLSATDMLLLTVVWFAGLCVETLVQNAALPGLGLRRALALNLAGSAVANSVPAGGAVSMGLNYAMLARWGIPASGFAQYALVLNLVSVLSKLLLPVLALAALVATATAVPHDVLVVTGVAGALAVAVGALVFSAPVARGLATVADRADVALAGRLRRSPVGAGRAVRALHRDAVHALAAAPWRTLVGAVGYAALQALLLGLCLGMLGAHVSWAVVLTGFAIERVLTTLPITPGGSGVAETGATLGLIALGVDAATATTAVVVYRAFVTWAEVPVGGVVALVWLVGGRARRGPGTPARA